MQLVFLQYWVVCKAVLFDRNLLQVVSDGDTCLVTYGSILDAVRLDVIEAFSQ